MGKGKKKALSDKVLQKNKQDPLKTTEKDRSDFKQNPFELKFNKQKQNIVGRTVSKLGTRVGQPGASRRRAEEIRNRSLLVEYKHFGKSNRHVDQRIGEDDHQMTADDKASQRFAAELKKRYGTEKKSKKRDRFQLDDNVDEEEGLTHYGQSLAEVEALRDRPLEREFNDDLDRSAGLDKIGRDFVAGAHFGGGEDDPNGAQRRNRKQLIMDLIAKSKLERHEKQALHDAQMDLTEQLDAQWKDLIGTVKGITKPPKNSPFALDTDEKEQAEQPNKDGYDAVLRRLQFDRKRAPATDRSKTEQEMAVEERSRLDALERQRQARMQIDESGTAKATHLSADDLCDDFALNVEEEVEIDVAEKENGRSIEIQQPDETEGDLEELLAPVKRKAKKLKTVNSSAATPQSVSIPFVFDFPKDFEDFSLMLSAYPVAVDKLTMLERLIKCHHPSLKEGNKAKLQKLFVYLLRYFDTTSRKHYEPAWLDGLAPILYKLSKGNATYAAKCCRALLRNQKGIYAQTPKRFPPLNCFTFLRLVPSLFPASDAWHPVTSGAMVFILKMLAEVRNKTPRDVSKGLLLCSIALEYVKDSKRYLPEVVAYLRSVFYLAIDHLNDERPCCAGFPIAEPHSKMLLVRNKSADVASKETTGVRISLSSVFFGKTQKQSEDVQKLSAVNCSVGLLRSFALLYSNVISYATLFRPFLADLGRLPTDKYPAAMCTSIEFVANLLRNNIRLKSKLVPLSRHQKQKSEFKFLEPRVERHFDPAKKAKPTLKGNSAKAESQLLMKKYRREVRGTVRELRKDGQFLAKQQLKERMDNDRMRKRKTNQIMRSLMGQESEFKKLKRDKAKM